MDFKGLDYDRIQKELTEFTQERPLEAVLLAFGAGLGLAVLASTRVLPAALKSVTIAALPQGLDWLKSAIKTAEAPLNEGAPTAGEEPAEGKRDSMVH